MFLQLWHILVKKKRDVKYRVFPKGVATAAAPVKFSGFLDSEKLQLFSIDFVINNSPFSRVITLTVPKVQNTDLSDDKIRTS